MAAREQRGDLVNLEVFAESCTCGRAIRSLVARGALRLTCLNGGRLRACPGGLAAGQERFDLLAPAAERAQHARRPSL